jgi:hypothetical protein
MSHALGLDVSVTGVVCSWVFFPLDSFLDSAICSFPSSSASSSASWSVRFSLSSGSSGSISSDSVSVSVSVSKVLGSLCSVSGCLVLSLRVLVCQLISSGLD